MRSSPQKVLSTNLKALMRAQQTNPKKVAARIASSKSTVERVTAGDVACRLDTLAELADIFDLEPWQLLIPGLDPKNPPILRQEDDKLRALYRSLELAMQKIAEYETTK